MYVLCTSPELFKQILREKGQGSVLGSFNTIPSSCLIGLLNKYIEKMKMKCQCKFNIGVRHLECMQRFFGAIEGY
jgi:hypothetical protein